MRAGSDNVERLAQIVHQGSQQIFRLGIVKWTHDVAQRICQVYRERAADGIVFSNVFLLVTIAGLDSPRRRRDAEERAEKDILKGVGFLHSARFAPRLRVSAVNSRLQR